MINIIYGLLSIWAFWGLYVLVMALYRAHLQKRLSKLVYALGAPFLVIGAAIDLLMNITLATVIFFDAPKEYLVTSRLKRYIANDDGWRCKVARSICDNLLDIFDPSGNHC